MCRELKKTHTQQVLDTFQQCMMQVINFFKTMDFSIAKTMDCVSEM